MSRLFAIVCTCVIGLAVVSTYLLAEPENMSVDFQTAIESLRHPEDHVAKEKIWSVKVHGWTESNAELAEVLNVNQAVLSELRKSAQFPMGAFESTGDKRTPNFSKVQKLCTLLFLDGRYHEWQKNYDLMIEDYVALLQLSQQLAQEYKSAPARMISLVCETTAVQAIKSALELDDLDERQLGRIHSELQAYARTHFTVLDIMKGEKREYLLLVQQMVNGISQDRQLWADKIMEQANLLANQYYGNYLRAAHTNAQTDWTYAQNEADAFSRECVRKTDSAQFVTALIWDVIHNDRDSLSEKASCYVAETALALVMFDYKGAAEQYDAAQAELQSLMGLVEKRSIELGARKPGTDAAQLSSRQHGA